MQYEEYGITTSTFATVQDHCIHLYWSCNLRKVLLGVPVHRS